MTRELHGEISDCGSLESLGGFHGCFPSHDVLIVAFYAVNMRLSNALFDTASMVKLDYQLNDVCVC